MNEEERAVYECLQGEGSEGEEETEELEDDFVLKALGGPLPGSEINRVDPSDPEQVRVFSISGGEGESAPSLPPEMLEAMLPKGLL